MNILIINCGSSSLGFKVYRLSGTGEPAVLISGKARNVATRTVHASLLEWEIGGEKLSEIQDIPDHRSAAGALLKLLALKDISINAAGHRIVHGGERFTRSTRIDEKVLADLQTVLPLAPIHNPNSFSVIDLFRTLLPKMPQFAVFDTAFHAQLPVEARTYAIPTDLAAKFGLRKYGFHGLSCQYVSGKAAQFLGRPVDQVRLILCHLGTGGSSVTAFRDGHSVETSMGYSPLAGLVMSTRCGDIDGEVVLELVRQGFSPGEVSRILNYESGLTGMSGYSSNLAEVIEAAEKGNDACRVAYEVYTDRLRFYLGAYTWFLNGADAIVFTDDIGVSSWKLRERALREVGALGIQLDPEKNRNVGSGGCSDISSVDSLTRLLVIPTDEERVILDEVVKLLSLTDQSSA